ncbi:MAG: methyltransferase domain-containing protein [Clostridiales bacterium]|nr:methyltransferase domain-containing protein [Clostridiales bacterium]
MVDTNEVKSFFDSLAGHWDDNMVINEKTIDLILKNAGIKSNGKVLDVACGTGVLIPYYLDRGVSSVTAIDISLKMIEIAGNKFKSKNVVFICDDAVNHTFDTEFDNIVVYNAFPHFGNPDGLIYNLSSCLKSGGRLTIAHSMSRDKINEHHGNISKNLFVDLMTIDELSDLVGRYLRVTITVSDENMYQIVAEKC